MNATNTHTPGPDEIAAFQLAIEEYSDAFGRTYDTPECDDAYNVGRTVAEMPDRWWPLFRAAPALLAALETLVLAHDSDGRFVSESDWSTAAAALRLARGA